MENDNRPALAVVCALSAMALFGLIDNFMRPAAEIGGLWQFHLLRSLIALGLLLVVAWFMGISVRPKRPRNVLGRSLLNGVAMCIYFGCLGLMPISQVVAGLFTAPIFVVIFSVAFFGETVGARRIFAVLLGFAGILMVIRPDAEAFSLLSAVPVLAGAIYALGIIATRRWCAGEGTLTLLGAFFGVMLGFGALGVLVLTLFPVEVPSGAEGFVVRGWVRPEGIFLTMIIVQGVGSLIGVGLSIKAYQLAEASFVAVFENMLIVFATVWAIILWGEVPSTISIIGIACVAGAGVIIAVRSEKPQTVRAVTLPE
jgi:drug/metabolite transporter (DMT)-like permease